MRKKGDRELPELTTMNRQTNQKLGWSLTILTIGLSLFITAFITTTSPLFAFNNSWDGNTMFTVGKGLWHGLMPYRDLFDQRGPLIYLMNSFSALISYKTFLGVYLFEALTVFFDIIMSYKIINLKFSRPISFASSLTLLPIVFNDYFFENGELPESLIMPLVLSLIYIVLKNNGKPETNFQLFGQGVAMAVVFWIKFSLILPWISFFGLIAVQALFSKHFHELLRKVAASLAGFMAVSVPLIIFYGVMGALSDLFKVYFIINLNYYPHSHLFSFQLIETISGFVFRNFRTVTISALFLIGILYLIFNTTFKWFPKIIILSAALLEVIVIVGNEFSFRYYFVALGVFMVFMSMGIASGLTYLTEHRFNNQTKVSLITAVIAVGSIFITNRNYRYTILFPHNQAISTNHNTTTPFQIQFAKIINKSKDRTILNYNNLDVGIYTATGTLPQTKYFAKLNLRGFRPLMDTQNYLLNNHQAHFVVFTLLENESIWDSDQQPDDSFTHAYRLVAQRKLIFQNHKMKYLLYELRS
ncbi:glycosyltransferase family 39 protein [Lactobacillus sp. Sy-1]|uniref:glycosyltransferase family 39 protein n=1 Tax=Lactobacillus sp. Sy-1 TaxID=2109645 RepID=UPI001C58BFE7|nr:glycosyltransferase family 39 protein [Lactobacillus sp. Sy-1]MBW1604783.1 glycosyltransferase family 39 protein [Lactobacillus sp. Sy-1]